MDYGIFRELKRVASKERGAFDRHPALITVGLVYPNSYRVGMSSMGFQLVYALLNALPGVRCERGFLLPGSPTYTVEGRAPLRAFDVLGFSLSSEPDYLNVVEILRRGKIPLLSADRDERHPLIMGGGLCAWLNPEPAADIFDLFVLGEAEAVLPQLFRGLESEGGRPRERLLRSLAEIPGIYVPRFFTQRCDAGGLASPAVPAADGMCPPSRQWVRDLDGWPARAPIVTPEAEFGEKVMIELMRGCGRQCRFCVTDYGYRPPRRRSRATVMRAVEEAMAVCPAVALLGPSLSDWPQLDDLCGEIAARGCGISVSSLRADCVSDNLLTALARGGLMSLTIAPETPSDHLQRKVNKLVLSGAVESIAERAREAGFRELKLYYLLGVEGETDDDIAAIAEEVRGAASRIRVRVSAGPLVPKARTPMQWGIMASEAELRRKCAFLRELIAGIPRVRLSLGSIREAMLEAALSRGDRSLARFLIEGRIPRSVKERFALMQRPEDEVFPWEHIDTGVARRYLREEYERFRRGEFTPPCSPDECAICGACSKEKGRT